MAGCSQSLGGSGPCSALKRETRLYANKEFDESAEFVPYQKMRGISKEDAVDYQKLQRGLLYGDADFTIDDMDCSCEYSLTGDEVRRVQSAINRQIGPIEPEIADMVLVEFSLTVSYQGQSASETFFRLVYTFGDGSWFTATGRSATVLATRLSDCQ